MVGLLYIVLYDCCYVLEGECWLVGLLFFVFVDFVVDCVWLCVCCVCVVVV